MKRAKPTWILMSERVDFLAVAGTERRPLRVHMVAAPASRGLVGAWGRKGARIECALTCWPSELMAPVERRSGSSSHPKPRPHFRRVAAQNGRRASPYSSSARSRDRARTNIEERCVPRARRLLAAQSQPSFKVQVLISTRRRPRRHHHVYTAAGMVLNTGVRLRPGGDGCGQPHAALRLQRQGPAARHRVLAGGGRGALRVPLRYPGSNASTTAAILRLPSSARRQTRQMRRNGAVRPRPNSFTP